MKRKKETGFTLIELIIVMIIVGILAAIVTPRFISLRDQAETAAVDGLLGSVRSAWAVAIGEAQNYPTLSELEMVVQGGQIAAGNIGLQVQIKNKDFVVRTYTGDGCHVVNDACDDSVADCTATTTTAQPITCVGPIEEL